MEKITLYVNTGYTSPYALAVFVALKEKGIPFELRELDLDKGEHLAPELADAFGTMRVPMFEHDGFRLTESSAICEYIEDTFSDGPALYPADPKQKARARQIQAWVRSDLMPIREERSTEFVWTGAKQPPLSEQARVAAAKLIGFAEALLPEGAEHVFGGWSIADTDLGVMLGRLVLNGDEVPPRLADYSNAQWRRPSVAAWPGRVYGLHVSSAPGPG